MTMHPSPYDAPHSTMMPQPPPNLAMATVIEPPSIKVFGIFHLVVAGLGIIHLLINIASLFFMDQFKNMMNQAVSGAGSVSAAGPNDAMSQMIGDIAIYNYLTIAFKLILAVLLIIAGIGLLKRREAGRVMSIRYAWTSIALKCLSLIIVFVIVIPALKRFNEVMYGGIGTDFASWMNWLQYAAQVLTVLGSCIYPIVVLIMMRKEKVKTFLAAQPR